jgi:hypothetical protein
MLNFIDVENEAELNPQHDDHPVYIPFLKAALSIGHFVIINVKDTNEKLVGQLIRSNPDNPGRVVVCCYLPLFDEATLQHINNPVVLPRALSHMACRNITELVNISKMATVNAEDIGGVAFIFLECDITGYIYHVQSMQNASYSV